ncbi:AMP-binding protein [Bacillus sp. Bva_UNVM-123]|uniref:AMP-binding protein n=1 Tax=Bacillus sp. Bva_UNVM-123 TaxID=2829798 RepID=UPI00391FAA66
MSYSQNSFDLSYVPRTKGLYKNMNNSEKWFSGQTIVDRFYEQVSKFPSRIALSNQNQRLTYAELNEYSNGVALELLNKGVKKGDFVGVFLNRSIEAVMGLLGVLKTGAIYVPIDPAYPAERIDYMISNTNCAVLLTESEVRKKLPILKNDPIIIEVNDNEMCKRKYDMQGIG